MEFDKRIKEGKKPLDCFDAENKELIKPFLNKEGYFSNNIENFCLLDGCFKRLLSNVSKEVKDCFKTSINGGDGGDWKYFLPVEWVKEPEKKYRPFSLEEFSNIFKVGDLVEFRYKDSDEVKCAMFTGYITDVERIDDKTPGACEIMLGIFHYSLFSLFEDFERFYNGRWLPFGIEVKDEE